MTTPYRPFTLNEARRRIQCGLPIYALTFFLTDDMFDNTLVSHLPTWTRLRDLPDVLPGNTTLHPTAAHRETHRARVLAVYDAKRPNCTMADLEAA